MKKQFTKNWILTGILLLSISTLAVLIPSAVAQDASTVTINAEVTDGCFWQGTPYASALWVLDNDLCVLTGDHDIGANNIIVYKDDGISPTQLGGKLIIGDDVTILTDITVGGTLIMNGILEIGVAGNHAVDSNLQVDGAVSISTAGSDGDLDIMANIGGSNTVDFNSTLTIASSSTGGSFTNNDDATTNTLTSVLVHGQTTLNHGILENFDGTITLSGQHDMSGYGALDNDGVFTIGAVNSYMNNYVSIDNSGTLNVNAANFIYFYSDTTLTNSGTCNGGNYQFYTTSDGTNTGIMNINNLYHTSTGIFNNNASGDINITGNLIVDTHSGVVNNNDSGTVTVDADTYIYSTGTGRINNNNSWETDLLQLGTLAGSHGGTFNNYGTLDFPAPAAYGINIHQDGTLANQSTGTITLSTSVFMEGEGVTDLASFTNANTAANAVDITGQIDMDAYSVLNNNGGMRVSGANNIDILDNNADITNGTNGDLTLAGTTEQVFEYGVAVDNDGTITATGSSVTFEDTASLDNAVGATLTISGAGDDLILNNTSDFGITNAGDISVNDDTSINNDSYITQSAGTFTTTDLLLTDATPTTPHFTMSGGTVTASADVRVYETSDINVNGGTLTGSTLYVGEISSQEGGTFDIDLTGALVLNGATYSHVYRGDLNIAATSTAATPLSMPTALSRLYIRGTAGDASTVTHAGSGTVDAREPWIYEGGILNLNDGIWDNTGTYLYVYSDGTTHGQLNIDTDAELHGVTRLTIGYAATKGGNVTNNGIIARNGTPATASTDLYFSNGGELDNYGTIDMSTGIIYMVNESASRYSHLRNQSGGYIKAGNLRAFNPNQTIDNYDHMLITARVYLNYSGDGGTFNNGDLLGTTPGTLDIGDRLYVQNGGQFNNHPDSTVTGIMTGTLTYKANYQALNFDGDVGNWPTYEQTVTQSPSGATATQKGVDDNGATGVLLLEPLSGTFVDDQTITGSSYGTAVADGTLLANAEFLAGETITGASSGTTATIVSVVSDDGTPGTGIGQLTLSNMTGGFLNSEAIIGTTRGSALVDGSLYPDTLGQVIVTGEGINGNATFNQFEGTDAGSQAYKLITDQFGTGNTGAYDTDINISDYIKIGTGTNAASSKFNVITVDSTPAVDPKLGTSTTQDAYVWSTSSYTNNGEMTIEGSATDVAKIEINNLFAIGTTGDMTLNGDMDILGTSAGFSVGGILNQGPDSYMYSDNSNTVDFDLRQGSTNTNSPNNWVPWVELGGTIDVYELHATDRSTDLNSGYLCLGNYTSSCVDSGNTITINDKFLAKNETGTGTTVVDIAVPLSLTSDLEVASGTSTYSTEVNQLASGTIDISNGSGLNVIHPNSTFNSNGPLSIVGDSGTTGTDYIYITEGGNVNLNYTGGAYDIGSVYLFASGNASDSTLTLASGAILNLDDYDNCSAVSNCVIRLHDNAATGTGAAVFNVNGTVNTVAGTEQSIQLGFSGTGTSGEGELNIGSTGTVNLDNTSGGEIRVDDSGRLVIADGGVLSSDSPMDVDGMYNDGTGNRGAYIGGTATVYTPLDIEATGTMDVGSNGTVTVTGSTTTVNGNLELDGTLNPGDLTVTSGGVISSGDGNHLTTGTGCGVGGNFGCGTSTNFFIDADSVDVQSGGLIASDGVSSYVNGAAATTPEGGAYGGEGVSNTNSTYGTAKAGGSTANHASAGSYSPTYGDSGDWSGGSSPGGGGVYIRSIGDITINGEIRANAYSNNTGSQAAGSGGTIIIEQDIDHTDTSNVFGGAGYIRANGGNSTDSSTEPGGGGRIIIESILLDDPNDSLSGYDFDSTHIETIGGSNTVDDAAAGTMVYLGDDNNPNGTLIADQASSGPTGGLLTDIPSTETFDRIEARNGADINYSTDPTAPTVCYASGTAGSSVTFSVLSCDDYDEVPDKPDTFFINDTTEGAQTRAETPSGGEPRHNNQTAGIYDLTPVLTFILRSPELKTYDYQKIEIEVDDSNQTFGSLVWDATGLNAIDLGVANVVNDSDRTIDIEYAGTTLSTGTPYFIRARFVDADGDAGLWTHMDMGNYYQFDVDGNMTITDGCSGAINLTRDGLGVDDPSTSSGNRYAAESCTFTVTSDSTAWQILFGLDPSNSVFENAGQTEDIVEIDNAGIDCNITTNGTGSEEEFGFNLSNLTGVLSTATEQDDCAQPFNSWNGTSGDYVFNIESIAEQIITAAAITASDTFDINIHSTVNASTAPDDYGVGVRAIITTNP